VSLRRALILTVCLIAVAAVAAQESDTRSFFPDIEGWARDGEVMVYSPDNLFEYINGAADVYLSYDFQELETASYDKGDRQSVTIEVYRFSSIRNAFGIYSAEQPTDTELNQLTDQGYHGKGIVNFWLGPYYVKITGSYLDDEDESFLPLLGAAVAGRIGGEMGLPQPIGCFPQKARIKNSEGYIAQNFLGYGFLRCAFVADYDVDGEEARAFLIEADDAGDAEAMLKAYLARVEKKGTEVALEKGVYRFRDPHQSSRGPLSLKTQGRYIWGIFVDDRAEAARYLDAIESCLE
jgi:hypothetical protein